MHSGVMDGSVAFFIDILGISDVLHSLVLVEQLANHVQAAHLDTINQVVIRLDLSLPKVFPRL